MADAVVRQRVGVHGTGMYTGAVHTGARTDTTYTRDMPYTHIRDFAHPSMDEYTHHPWMYTRVCTPVYPCVYPFLVFCRGFGLVLVGFGEEISKFSKIY